MPIDTFSGKLVLVTGAASGIGQATALATAARGARMVLTDIDAVGLERTAQSIRTRGGTVAHAGAADIADHAAVVAFAQEVHDAHGSLDVVMNVAGISIWGPVDRLEHEDWRRLVDVNLMGPIHVIETFLPPMMAARRGGHLVNVSSAAGLFGLPWHAAYSATKFGLRGISEVLRFDLRRHRIGVSLVCPGGVDTPLVGTVQIAGMDRDDPRLRKLQRHFRRHATSPEKVAERILDGVERNRYLVHTSTDVRVGHFFQRHFAPPYELAMRLLNDALVAATRRRR